MRFSFRLRGIDGTVAVDVVPNDAPEALRCRFPEAARGLPACTAVIDHPGRGYTAAMGWVQLVRSSDGSDGFDPDPLGFYGDLNVPYAFFGIRPTLFDAPSRDSRADMTWLAHSFLCFSPTMVTREVRAVLGFSWGFDIRSGEVVLRPVLRLPAESWDAHGPRLAAAYPGWSFRED
ncbi:hypothetical protein ACFOY2_44640 [Nonomuraea purpurea]|uniref:Uncharacterized protein n=1 Tax=Nonomuraea purpurea TaxID=1849276 RepID=A0ABV8GNW1_9ACTN